MQVVTITQAKTQLSALIKQIKTSGEEILIGQRGEPEVKLSLYKPKKNKIRLGLFKGQATEVDNLEEWKEIKKLPEDMAKSLGIID